MKAVANADFSLASRDAGETEFCFYIDGEEISEYDLRWRSTGGATTFRRAQTSLPRRLSVKATSYAPTRNDSPARFDEMQEFEIANQSRKPADFSIGCSRRLTAEEPGRPASGIIHPLFAFFAARDSYLAAQGADSAVCYLTGDV